MTPLASMLQKEAKGLLNSAEQSHSEQAFSNESNMLPLHSLEPLFEQLLEICVAATAQPEVVISL